MCLSTIVVLYSHLINISHCPLQIRTHNFYILLTKPQTLDIPLGTPLKGLLYRPQKPSYSTSPGIAQFQHAHALWLGSLADVELEELCQGLPALFHSDAG